MTDETERPAIVEVSPGGVGFIRTDAHKPTLAGMPHASRKAWVEGDPRTNEQIALDAAADWEMFVPSAEGSPARAIVAALAAAGRLRDNTPTDVRERIARAIFDVRDDEFDMDEWDDLDSSERERYLCDADAALRVIKKEADRG